MEFLSCIVIFGLIFEKDRIRRVHWDCTCRNIVVVYSVRKKDMLKRRRGR